MPRSAQEGDRWIPLVTIFARKIVHAFSLKASRYDNVSEDAVGSSKKEIDQKRHQGRLKVTLDGHYRFAGDEGWQPCQIFDLSANGIAIGGKQSFYSGDKIEVRFGLEYRTVTMQVEITNLTGRKAGGRITGMPDAEREFLYEVLSKQLLAGKSRLT